MEIILVDNSLFQICLVIGYNDGTSGYLFLKN